MCTVIRLLLLIRPFISSFFFLCNFQTLKFFVTLFSGTVRPKRLKLVTHVDSGQMYSVFWNQAVAAYLSLCFSLFFLSNFQTLKFFIILFSGTVRPRRLKLVTHVDSGQMYSVFWNQAVAAYLSLCFSLFFLSNFQTLKFFIILFSGTVRPRRLKLVTHVDSGQMYSVFWNQAVAAHLSLCFSLFFLSNFQTLKFFIILFSGTVRPRRLKLVRHVDSGQMYSVFWNQAVAAYLSLCFSLFFLSNFQTLKFFIILFSGTVRPRRLKLVTHVNNGWMYRVYHNHAAALIRPFIFSFFFPIFKH